MTDKSFCYLFEFSSEKGVSHRSVTVALLTWRGFGFYYPTFGSQKMSSYHTCRLVVSNPPMSVEWFGFSIRDLEVLWDG